MKLAGDEAAVEKGERSQLPDPGACNRKSNLVFTKLAQMRLTRSASSLSLVRS